jgi:hypothetical protein
MEIRMSHQKLLSALALSASALFAGAALAQGSTPGNRPGGMPQPADTAVPTEPAQRVDPSASGGDNASDAASKGESKSASSARKHAKKKHKAAAPKPADNDNNATPNTPPQ